MTNLSDLAIGADIGGSHITAGLYNLRTHRLLETKKIRISVNSMDTADAILERWTEALLQSAGDEKIREIGGIGFAMPGPFDYPGGIALFRDVNKFDSLYGVDIRSEIRKRLDLPASFPVRFQNDAACFAIGESWHGEVAGYQRLLAVTLGTGFGTTFIHNHYPVAGQFGIPDDGFLYRVPFGDSVADDYFSTRWFTGMYREKTGKEVTGVKELAVMAPSSPIVHGLFTLFGESLGDFLAPWLKNFGAECLVMGGNISASRELFWDTFMKKLQSHGVKIPVFISELQENAAIAGSAILCDQSYYQGLGF